jgi:hypothetical protein
MAWSSSHSVFLPLQRGIPDADDVFHLKAFIFLCVPYEDTFDLVKQTGLFELMQAIEDDVGRKW